jgi:hypothetical protein
MSRYWNWNHFGESVNHLVTECSECGVSFWIEDHLETCSRAATILPAPLTEKLISSPSVGISE